LLSLLQQNQIEECNGSCHLLRYNRILKKGDDNLLPLPSLLQQNQIEKNDDNKLSLPSLLQENQKKKVLPCYRCLLRYNKNQKGA